jgi:hypothetical protein
MERALGEDATKIGRLTRDLHLADPVKAEARGNRFMSAVQSPVICLGGLVGLAISFMGPMGCSKSTGVHDETRDHSSPDEASDFRPVEEATDFGSMDEVLDSGSSDGVSSDAFDAIADARLDAIPDPQSDIDGLEEGFDELGVGDDGDVSESDGNSFAACTASRETAERACLWITTCGYPGSTLSLWQCIGEMMGLPCYGESTIWLDCANVGTCDEYLACLVPGHLQTCSTAPYMGCDGDVAVDCWSHWGSEVVDCASAGLRCDNSTWLPHCVAALQCDSESVGQACVGNWVVTCAKGSVGTYQLEARCPAAASCTEVVAETAGGTYGPTIRIAYCKGDDPACSTPGAWCDGTQLVRCHDPAEVNGLVAIVADPARLVETRADCAWFGMVCRGTEMGGIGCFAPDGSACEPGMYDDTCSDAVVTTCVAGDVVSLQCESVNKSGCVVNDGRAKCL